MNTHKIKWLLIGSIFLALAVISFLCIKFLHPRNPGAPAQTQLQAPAIQSVTEEVPPLVENPPVLAEAPAENEVLRQALEEALDGVSSQWAVCCETLDGKSCTVVCKNTTADTPMVSASIIKIFILGAIYDRIEKGLIAEEDVYDTCYQMITVSDNAAANSLTLLLGDGSASAGEQAVNAFAASIGCTGVSHNRLMLENNGTQNYVSMNDCATILRMIYGGTCVSPAASAKMLGILLAQKDHDYIPSGVPEGVEIAHKGGDLTDLCHGDVGIVFAEGKPYIVCIICNMPNSYEGAWAKITEVSSLIYTHTVPSEE
ncbi:MAG: class A beta-lactamase-related serine hydrolase [Clostridia bacterium]|nr:class A beta-lactamase-related serine hydrolase [Clostridia bacterium]